MRSNRDVKLIMPVMYEQAFRAVEEIKIHLFELTKSGKNVETVKIKASFNMIERKLWKVVVCARLCIRKLARNLKLKIR